jgi:hypothetical protein
LPDATRGRPAAARSTTRRPTTLTFLTGLVDAVASRPATPRLIERLIAFGRRFEDDTHYTTLYLGDFTGHHVKRVIRRAIAESIVRRDAPHAADWPRK